MEQQNTVQSLGEWAKETTELSLNDIAVPYEFRDGLYYCEGVEGGYSSLTTLKRAWALKTRAKRMKEAHTAASAVGRLSKKESDKEKARKEYRKWQQTEIE